MTSPASTNPGRVHLLALAAAAAFLLAVLAAIPAALGLLWPGVTAALASASFGLTATFGVVYALALTQRPRAPRARGDASAGVTEARHQQAAARTQRVEPGVISGGQPALHTQRMEPTATSTAAQPAMPTATDARPALTATSVQPRREERTATSVQPRDSASAALADALARGDLQAALALEAERLRAQAAQPDDDDDDDSALSTEQMDFNAFKRFVRSHSGHQAAIDLESQRAAPAHLQPGALVLVPDEDGDRVLAEVLQYAEDQSLCRLTDGQKRWFNNKTLTRFDG
jgi:hypothetical protein